jgi:hypothetical protein
MHGSGDPTIDSLPAGIRDHDPSSCGRAAAVLHDLKIGRRKSVAYKIEQFGREPRKEPGIGTATLSSFGE